MQLAMQGKGNAGPRGGIAGDLIVLIEELEHDTFERQDANLYYNAFITYADAALGASVEIPTLNGKVKIKIDPGTPSGRVVRLRGKGLPVMNGYEATEAIRALPDPALASIPIIAMTANAFAEDVQNAKAAGMDDHIAKPLNIPEMMSTLERILKKS